MGGVPTLLLVIAAGITYGWQPDREGGVEYIIQIPPDQIQRLEQTGEITSVIDPQVQGHVSRVIIRVGNGPLPKSLPTNLSGRTASRSADPSPYAVADAAPIPIPEMGDSAIPEPIPGDLSTRPVGEQAVLKPDTNAPPGTTGYGFPPPPTTLQTAPPQVDQAGRTITNGSSGQTNPNYGSAAPPLGGASNTGNASGAPVSGGIMRVPPPATRTSGTPSYAQPTPPPFTGSDPRGAYAGARAGGPSTEPRPRDNTWKDFPAPPSTTANTSGASTSGAANSTGMSSPPPENPFQSSSPSSATASAPPSAYTSPPSAYGSGGSSGIAPGSSGMAPGDTYGRVPSGLSFNSGNASASAPTSTNPSSSNRPDPLLHPAQVQAGAWSVDKYGRIYDRQGNLMSATPGGLAGGLGPAPTTGSPQRAATGSVPVAGSPAASSPATFAGTNTTRAGATTLGSSASGPASALPGTGFNAGFKTAENRAQTTAAHPNSTLGAPTAGYPTTSGSSISHVAEPRLDQIHRASAAAPAASTAREGAVLQAGDPPSLSDRAGTGNSTSTPAHRETVAPQPLFNGLLLVSIVANIYLMFWLKNLRIQFREMVAAKRMASSSSQ